MNNLERFAYITNTIYYKETFYMYEEYVRETPIIEKTEDERNAQLIQSILMAKKDLELANRNYEFAEGELIDYYLYQMKAIQSKLNYLLGKAKKKALIVDRIQQLEIRSKEA